MLSGENDCVLLWSPDIGLHFNTSLFPDLNQEWNLSNKQREPKQPSPPFNHLVDDAQVINEANADDGDSLLFAEHCAGYQSHCEYNTTPTYKKRKQIKILNLV